MLLPLSLMLVGCMAAGASAVGGVTAAPESSCRRGVVAAAVWVVETVVAEVVVSFVSVEL